MLTRSRMPAFHLRVRSEGVHRLVLFLYTSVPRVRAALLRGRLGRVGLCIVLASVVLIPQARADSVPILQVEREKYDLGRVEPNERMKETLRISNRGEGLLVISRISSTCGCLVPAKKDERKLPPGETLEVPFELVTDTSMHGVTTKMLMIYSNDPRTPKLPIQITFYVKPKYTVTCIPDVLRCGKLEERGTRTQSITLISPYPSPLRIVNSTASHEGIQVESLGAGSSANVQRFQITLSAEAWAPGPFEEAVNIRTGAGEVSIPVVGYRLGKFDVSPPSIVFGVFEEGGMPCVNLRIKSRLGEPFRIVDTREEGNLLDLEWVGSEEGMLQTLRVSPALGLNEGLFKGTLCIETSGGEVMNVPYWGLKR